MITPSCHPDRVHYAKGACYNCYMVAFRKANPAYTSRVKEQSRAWRRKHPKYDTPRVRNRRITNPAVGHVTVHRKYKLRKHYNLTQAEFNAMLTQQEHRCLICKQTFDPKNIRLSSVIDHCHTSNRVRGLLCRMCNVGLGAFNENITALKQAAAYLQTGKGK